MAGHPLPEDDEADGYTAPARQRFKAHVTICPSCSRPLAKHDAMALLRCTQDLPAEGTAKDVGAVVGDKPTTRRASPPAPTPERVRVDEVAVVEAQPSAAATAPPVEPIDTTARDEGPVVVDRARGLVTLPSRELDFEELAAALRTVIEKERDEIVRRGGPLEKQNAELKERLADALDNAAMWRRRAQANAEQRNTLERQLNDMTKTNRKLRNELKGRKENNRSRVLELPDLLRIVQSSEGFTVERSGNGHYLIRKDGVFVTDAASSGQGNKVNMATRVALRKVGLEV